MINADGPRKDPRNIRDKTYQHECIRTLIRFLADAGYDRPVSPKILSAPSVKDFQNIFTFLYHQLDPAYVFGTKFEEEIPTLIRNIGYVRRDRRRLRTRTQLGLTGPPPAPDPRPLIPAPRPRSTSPASDPRPLPPSSGTHSTTTSPRATCRRSAPSTRGPSSSPCSRGWWSSLWCVRRPRPLRMQ